MCTWMHTHNKLMDMHSGKEKIYDRQFLDIKSPTFNPQTIIYVYASALYLNHQL